MRARDTGVPHTSSHQRFSSPGDIFERNPTFGLPDDGDRASVRARGKASSTHTRTRNNVSAEWQRESIRPMAQDNHTCRRDRISFQGARAKRGTWLPSIHHVSVYLDMCCACARSCRAEQRQHEHAPPFQAEGKGEGGGS